VIDTNAEQPEEAVYVLIDGHNRFEICQKFGVDFKISVVEFKNFD
jgi:ParB-like chromosome segregation protein Spo0J